MSSRRSRKRGHAERYDIEAVEKILAKAALLDFFFQIAIGRGDQADVQLDGARSAHALEFTLLQHAQQLGLQQGRQLADFVQENRAALGDFELAFFLGDGAGERAFFVAEQLAFEQVFGQRGAVDGHARLVGAAAVAMDGARHQFLAGSALARRSAR